MNLHNKIIHFDFHKPVSSFVLLRKSKTTRHFGVSANKGVWCEDNTGATVGLYCQTIANGGLNYSKTYIAEEWIGYVDVDYSQFVSPGVSVEDVWLRTYSCSIKQDWQLQNINGFCKLSTGGGTSLPYPIANHTYIEVPFYHIIQSPDPDNDPIDLWYPYNPNTNTNRELWYGLSVRTFELNANSVKGNKNDQSLELNFFPNPANNTVSISSSYIDRNETSILLYDMLGRTFEIELNKQEGSNSFYINVNGLTNGIYFINMALDNKMVNCKINVQHE